jgi:hypothetical protein
MVHESRESGEEPDGAEHSGGVVIGGSMTGGAIATGKQSSARDSSRREGTPTTADLPAPNAPAGPVASGQVFVAGHVTGGAVAAGEGSEAVYEAVTADAAYQELLSAVTLLRQHLTLLARGADVESADGELAAVQEEITRTGRAETGRLRRLRERLTDAKSVLAALASAATVAEVIHGLVG